MSIMSEVIIVSQYYQKAKLTPADGSQCQWPLCLTLYTAQPTHTDAG